MLTQRSRYKRWVDDGPEKRCYPTPYQRNRTTYGIEFVTSSDEEAWRGVRRRVILTGEEIARIAKLAQDCGLLPDEPI
jgi:hypothetical protein